MLGVGSTVTHNRGLWLWGKGVGLGPPESPSPFSPSPCSAPERHTEQRRTLDTAPPEPGRQPWPQLGPCPVAASSLPAQQPPCRRHLLPRGPRFPRCGRPRLAGPAPPASWPGSGSRSPRPAGRRSGEAWAAGGEGLHAAGPGWGASDPGAAEAPAGRSPGAGSAAAAPPRRAACRRAGVAGRAAAEREPTGRQPASAQESRYRREDTSGSGTVGLVWSAASPGVVITTKSEVPERKGFRLGGSPTPGHECRRASLAQRGRAVRDRLGTAPRGAEVREDADTVSNRCPAGPPARLPPPPSCRKKKGAIRPGSRAPKALPRGKRRGQMFGGGARPGGVDRGGQPRSPTANRRRAGIRL